MRTPIMKNVVQRSWSLFILLAVIVIPVAIPAASTSVIPHALPSTETTTAALDLLAALDEGDLESLSKNSPSKLRRSIQRATPKKSLKPGQTTSIEFTAEDGRDTKVTMYAPSSRQKSYGLIVMLHGYGGNGRSVVSRSYQNFANKNGYIVVSPDAKRPAETGQWNEDLPRIILGSPTQHWWVYRSDAFINSILNELTWK